ncbi:unnamed protein product, partial [Symbiodinium pilosum]
PGLARESSGEYSAYSVFNKGPCASAFGMGGHFKGSATFSASFVQSSSTQSNAGRPDLPPFLPVG